MTCFSAANKASRTSLPQSTARRSSTTASVILGLRRKYE
jgi:hypothetical protein